MQSAGRPARRSAASVGGSLAPASEEAGKRRLLSSCMEPLKGWIMTKFHALRLRSSALLTVAVLRN